MPPKKKDDNMFETILEKLEALATGRSEDKMKLDAILTQTTQLQGEITNLREQVKKLQEDFQTADKSILDIQKELEMKADIKDLERLKEEFLQKTDDLENRSKHNNLVFWNVPEGEESGRGCIRLFEDIIVNHMKLKDTDDVVIERAHRSGVKKSAKDGKEFSRPIHCRFLQWGDKEYVMKKPPCALKNNPYGERKLLS